MEIVTSLPTDTTGASGGTKKHVEEWSRLDRLTGMLEHARVEADHWASNTSNSRHHYGKVVDSRARNLADGSVQQQQQTKQLEVFQAHIPGGSVQVIRSHTSTSSSWQKSKILQNKSHMDWSADIGDKNSQRTKIIESPIDTLKLHHNLINLDTEKTKANVARFLPIRRPPTRGKSLKTSSEDDFFNDLPKICSDAQKETEKRLDAIAKELKSTLVESISLHRAVTNGVADDSNEHRKLEKKKSISDENLSVVDEKENSDPWKRDSKARWSFQYPRSKFKDSKVDLESKSELETVLEKVLKRKGEAVEKQPTVEHLIKTTPPLWKRKSFVTEQTLKETKQKLRHLNIDDCKVEITRTDNEDTDDGICTGSKGNSDKEDDKEDLLYVKKSDIIGTGSLELRNKNKSDDWFDRRKSYGFEPVYGQRNIVALKNTASKANTSTDSGICRSSELELISTPIVKKLAEANTELCHNINSTDDFQESTSKTVGVSELLSKFEKKSETRATATVLTLPQAELPTRQVEAFDGRENIKCGKVAKLIRSLRENTIPENAFRPKSTVKIESCCVDETKNILKDAKNFDTDLLSKRHSIACDDAQYIKFKDVDELHDKPMLNSCDLDHLNTTVINVNNFESGDATTAITVDNSALFVGEAADIKKPKKVEFSKTEVHFAAAEPGKIKIVETDEKPPPANLYRRKKRSVSASPKIDASVPQTKFGYQNLHEEIGEDQIEPAREFAKSKMFNSGQFTSSTSDNGLAVRISSTKPSDFRRASWSVVDTNENKSGYSTKINFGGQGITVVADAKSQKYDQFKDLDTNYERSCSNDLDEISEKSHFKPLRSEEEKLKTVTSTTNVDIKRPKITSVAVNLPSVTTSVTEDSKNVTKNCTTVLLNNTVPKSENCNSKLKNDQTVINDLSAKSNSYESTRKNNCSFKITTTVKSIPTTEGNNNSKQDYKPIKVIHHGVRVPEKQKPVEYRHVESLRKETSKKEPSKNKVIKTLSGNSTSASSGSIRKKPAYDKERLFDSGRDSWLNLPKERKPTNEKKMYAECAKIKPIQFRKTQTEDKRRNEKDSNMNKTLSDYLSNGVVDGSSEEDAYRHSYKKHLFTQPLTTISEKSSLKVNKKVDSGPLRLSGSKAPVTRTTSNSSLESRSNAYEFKNPVLKTEERSKRRTTRMIQRASSREALLNAVSSSEDITSENEISCLRSSKLKSPRKLKSCKASKINQSLQETNPNINRIIKQQTAKMEINIFNIKERPNDKTIIYPSSRSHPSKNVITKSRPKQDQQGTELHTSSQKSRISHRSTNNGKKNVYNQSSPLKVVRPNAKQGV